MKFRGWGVGAGVGVQYAGSRVVMGVWGAVGGAKVRLLSPGPDVRFPSCLLC